MSVTLRTSHHIFKINLRTILPFKLTHQEVPRVEFTNFYIFERVFLRIKKRQEGSEKATKR